MRHIQGSRAARGKIGKWGECVREINIEEGTHQGWAKSFCRAPILGLGTVFFVALLSGCSVQQKDATSGFRGSSTSKPPVAPAVAKVHPQPAEPQRRIAVDGMGLSDAVGVAIARHPDLSRADALVTQSASEVAIAEAAWYPTIEYSAKPGYGRGYASSGDNGAVSGSVGVNQMIYDFGRTPNRISAADATLVKQKYLRADTMETIALNTAAIYLELANSQDVIAAAQRQLTALRETRAKIVERLEAGLSDVSDRNQADVAVQRADAEVLKAKTRFSVAAGKLAELTGVRPQRVASLASTGAFISRLGTAVGDIDRTPSVLAAKASVDVADARIAVAKAERFPTIGLGVSRSMSTRQRNDRDDTYVGLSISGSFSLGGLTGHRIESAEAERKATAQTLENQRLVARTALGSAELEAAGASARVASYDKIIDLARTSRDLYWQEYTLDKRPLTEVISAEREIYFSEVERISAFSDGALAKIRAHSAVGQLVALLKAQGEVRK